MYILCLDLEGVLVPEVWINVAERTGIPELRATTRDVPDYDELMQMRLGILARHGLDLPDIQAVIATLEPLDGALAFLDWARERFQPVIVSDTFYEFGLPLMRQLGHPFLLCHKLQVDAEGRITGYRLRQADPKRKTVQGFHAMHCTVLAAGDSYNDTSMLEEADRGILFKPPANVIQDFPQFPVSRSYDELKMALLQAAAELESVEV